MVLHVFEKQRQQIALHYHRVQETDHFIVITFGEHLVLLAHVAGHLRHVVGVRSLDQQISQLGAHYDRILRSQKLEIVNVDLSQLVLLGFGLLLLVLGTAFFGDLENHVLLGDDLLGALNHLRILAEIRYSSTALHLKRKFKYFLLLKITTAQIHEKIKTKLYWI